MKKFTCLFIAIILVFSLCACSSSGGQGMSIKPSEFSKETREVLELLKDELQFFDVSLDESAKYFKISVWVKRDGEWLDVGGVSDEISWMPARIAVRLTDDSFELYLIDDKGQVGVSYPLEDDFDNSADFVNSAAFFGSKIDSETPLELNKELTLWAKYGTEKTSIEASAAQHDFRDVDCNAGTVVTLTVSDKPLE